MDSHFSRASRGICTKSAVAMARIFWHHRQKFDGKQIFCIGMQHAGAAATALIAALAYIPDTQDRNNNMSYLEVLHSALQDMCHAYSPAERMAKVLSAAMIELRGGPVSPGKAVTSTSRTIPARRGSAAVEERPTTKRRQTSRSRKTNPMPPPTSVRQHRVSDASNNSYQQHSQSDYVMVTPRTEGHTWPDVHGIESFHDPSLMATPQDNDLLSPDRRNDWMAGAFQQDFPTMPSLAGLGMTDSDAFPEFLHSLPNNLEDWSRWHNGPEVVSQDLDGYVNPWTRGYLNMLRLDSVSEYGASLKRMSRDIFLLPDNSKLC